MSGAVSQSLILAGGTAALLIGCGALYGWGRLVRRVAGSPDGAWPVTVALGLACWIFLGGLLNLCRLAFPGALDALVLIGLGLAAAEWRRAEPLRCWAACWPPGHLERVYRVTLVLIMLLIIGFAMANQLAPALYNYGDDFQKYFAYPERMVETGTVYGSPLNSLGFETLGGQAFLQGFIVGHFPIRFINGADRIFCFGLCVMLAGGVSFGRPRLGLAAIVATLAVFLIDPQYVNVSALYSMAALFMALVILKTDPRERAASIVGHLRSELPAALCYAGVVALKPSGIVFVILLFTLSALASAWAERDLRRSAQGALSSVVLGALFLAPWVLIYAPYYGFAFVHHLPDPATPLPNLRQSVRLLSPAASFYGASFLSFTVLALGLSVYALTAGFVAVKHDNAPQRERGILLAAACTAAASAYVIVNLVGTHFIEINANLRYSIPVLIGVVPAVLGLGAVVLDDARQSGRRGTWLAAAFGIGLMVFFLPSSVERIGQVRAVGSDLAFIRGWSAESVANFTAFERAVLDGSIDEEIRHFQRQIPAGEPVIAWIETPFLLDFARNPIIDVNETGLSTPWSAGSDARYILWQYRGYGITEPQGYLATIRSVGRLGGFVAAHALDFYLMLGKLSKQAKILADEDGIALLELPSQPATSH